MLICDEFNKMLIKRLLRGDMVATGIPESGGRRRKIAAFEWQDLDFYGYFDSGCVVAWRKPGVSPEWGFRDIAVKFARMKK